MHFRSIIFTLSLILLTGCLSLAQPSKRHREEASARATEELVAHRSKLEGVTFLVLASDRPASYEVSSQDDKFYFKFVDPKTGVGLATGISEDGYLITAAHVTTRQHCYVVGWMEGKPAVFPARVVYKQLRREFGEDLAILRVDKRLDCPIQLGTLDSAGSEIYAFALDRQAGVKFTAVAGKVVLRPKPNPGKDISIMETDLPLWKGDSGSAVMSKDGKLVGVFIGVDILTTFKASRIACVPDMDRVLSIIANDRLLTPCGERNMNRLCSLLFICWAGHLFAQTNSPSVSPQLFSMPQVGLRLSNSEPHRTPVVAADSRMLHLGLAQSQDVSVGPEPATNAGPETSFETTSASGSLSGVSLRIYERLEKGGYLTRPELPSENRLDRLVNTIFVPESIQFRKASVSCSIITAIKRKNPLCLINPIFLDVRW